MVNKAPTRGRYLLRGRYYRAGAGSVLPPGAEFLPDEAVEVAEAIEIAEDGTVMNPAPDEQTDDLPKYYQDYFDAEVEAGREPLPKYVGENREQFFARVKAHGEGQQTEGDDDAGESESGEPGDETSESTGPTETGEGAGPSEHS